MHRFRHRLPLTGGLLVAATLTAPACGAAQERTVVSKQIAVGGDEASLRLEFDGGAALDVRLEGGEVRVNDRVVGAYQPGGAMERAWRQLLGEAVALNDGRLARALLAWTPPALEGDAAAAAAAALDASLEEALRASASAAEATADARVAAEATAAQEALLGALLGRSDRLVELAGAVGDLDMDQVRIHVDDDVRVEAGERVESTLLVVDGDVRVAGEVDGSVVMVGGSLTLEEGSRISGDVRLADGARLFREGGSVEGDVEIAPSGDFDQMVERDVRERLREELRSDLRREILHEARADFDVGWSPLRSIGRGLGGLMQNLVGILVLGVLVGGLAVHFAPNNLDVVGRTVREAPLRAAMVGVAGVFVALPAWVLGFVALAISIVGILAIPFWAVLFPLAVVAGVALGYLAVAQIVGEWVASRRYERLDWVRVGNPLTTVIAGVGALMLAFMVANVLEMAGPWTGVFQGILFVIGVMAMAAAALVGFGAVLLTRGGRRPEYPDAGGFDDWDSA